MKKLLIGSATFVAFAAFGLARAADMPPPVYKAPPPPVYNWTGCYTNGGVGYGMWNQDHYAEFGPPIFTTGGFDPVSVTYTNGGRGWLGTIGGGCDYQFSMGNLGNWVVGAFGDYDPMSLTGTNESQLPITTNIADISGSETETGAWYVGGRIGYLVTPTLLTYFEGGYTQARFGQVNFSREFLPSVATAYSLPGTTYSGWFLGSGIEYALTWLPIQGLFWRSEYRYASYEAQDVPLVFTSTGTQSGYYEHSQKYVQTATSSLVWRFNWFGR